jgi:hypothetical protein
VDEAAFFEVLFLGHGVKTVYCEETFTSDTSPMASLIKSVRRVMASEYSRDRSRLVRYAQSRAARLGFWAGGPPPYGMRRLMVTRDGNPVQVLERGQWKALASHRTRLVPGDPEAVATVRRIYDLFDHDGVGLRAIANLLNGEGVPSSRGCRWYEPAISAILSNSTYAGLGRYRPQRKGLSDPLPASQVEDLTVQGAPGPEPIIDVTQFRRVQALTKRHTIWRPCDELAKDARIAFERHGCVERAMLHAIQIHCCWATYPLRFPGGIDEALTQAYASEISEATGPVMDRLRQRFDVSADEGAWMVDRTLRVRVAAVFPRRRDVGLAWQVRRPSKPTDLLVCVGVGEGGSLTNDLYAVPSRTFGRRRRLYLRCDGTEQAEGYRVTTESLPDVVARLRYTSGRSSERRLIEVARERPLVNLRELSRTLDWPYHAVGKMYRRLRNRGEWFPALEKTTRFVEVVCARCGKRRAATARLAMKLLTNLCVACSRRRPINKVKVRCPRCEREAFRWPSAVKLLSAGVDTVCALCRPRGRRDRLGRSAATGGE